MNRTRSILMIIVITGAVLFSYQNCGMEPPQSMFDARYAYKLPYEASADQIAYMSCSEQDRIPNERGVYFTLRAGAYRESAGLRLSDSFYQETRRDNKAAKARKLSEEFVSMNYRLIFSLRQRTNLAISFSNGGSEGIEELDYDFVFGDLGSPAMSASLLELDTDEYLNYWAPAGIESDAYMEGTMVFNSAENLAQTLRTFLERDGLVTLGYARPNNPGALLTRAAYGTNQDDDGDGRKDDSDDDIVPLNEAYGTGLRVSFRQPNASNWGGSLVNIVMPKRVLATAYEYDLSNPQQIKSTWSCPSNLQLRIVPPADGAAQCPDLAVEEPADPTQLANYQIVRRSLPFEHWKINWARKCAVPKFYAKGSCYGIDTRPIPTVPRAPQYDLSQACDPAALEANRACLHFVSICLRP